MAGSGDVPPAQRFARLLAGDEDRIPLDEAVLLIAAVAQPGLDVGVQLERLDALAASCPDASLAGLRRHLFEDLGFAGNREGYADPKNSYLDQVLDRRLGIPISLSVLTIEVGRRIGLDLTGVGMPGHFLVGAGSDPPTFVDPFNGGAVLDEDGCEAVFRNLGGTGPFLGSYLAPTGPRAILSRMLANLQRAFLPAELRSAAWVLELRLAIPGLPAEERRDLARALGSLGRVTTGAAELDRVAAAFPQDEAERLRAEATALRARAN